jgi:hypothetical protein
MTGRKLLNLVLSFLVIASMLLMPAGQARADNPTPPASDGVPHVHEGMVSPAERQAAAERAPAAKTGGASAQAMPMPGGVPD